MSCELCSRSRHPVSHLKAFGFASRSMGKMLLAFMGFFAAVPWLATRKIGVAMLACGSPNASMVDSQLALYFPCHEVETQIYLPNIKM